MKIVPLMLVLTCMLVATLAIAGCGQRVYPNAPTDKLIPSSSH